MYSTLYRVNSDFTSYYLLIQYEFLWFFGKVGLIWEHIFTLIPSSKKMIIYMLQNTFRVLEVKRENLKVKPFWHASGLHFTACNIESGLALST